MLPSQRFTRVASLPFSSRSPHARLNLPGWRPVQVIDFGAAVDFSIGINFNPMSGMLDFRYSPPEELITPLSFPKPPLPVLAALAAPVAWQAVRPDLFDTFSCGLLLLQLSIPQMRTAMQQKNFKRLVLQAFPCPSCWAVPLQRCTRPSIAALQ